MKQETVLKIFGTGQVTIPKEWRDAMGSNLIKAIFDDKKGTFTAHPVKMVEIETFKPMSPEKLGKELKKAGFGSGFVSDAVIGYKKSSLSLKKKK